MHLAKTRLSLSLFSVLIASFMTPFSAQSQAFPSKQIRIVIPYPPGGISDQMLRPVAQKMAEGLRTSIVIDNRPGANGIIGTDIVAKSAPDGYTLVMGSTSSLPMNAAIYPKLPFDPIKDLFPISSFAYAPQVLTVHPALKATTVQELVALAKASATPISYGSTGVGSSNHFTAEIFAAKTGIKLLHVPYKGGAHATNALVAGEVMMTFGSIGSAAPFIRSGRIRALGIASPNRSPAAPEIPTIAESGVPAFEGGTLFALFAPASTPRSVIMQLHAEMARVLALPEIREAMASVGTEAVAMTPEELGAVIKSDIPKWAKVAKDANIKAE